VTGDIPQPLRRSVRRIDEPGRQTRYGVIMLTGSLLSFAPFRGDRVIRLCFRSGFGQLSAVLVENEILVPPTMEEV